MTHRCVWLCMRIQAGPRRVSFCDGKGRRHSKQKTHTSWLLNMPFETMILPPPKHQVFKFLTWARVLWYCHVATKWRSHSLIDALLSSTFPLVLPCHHLLSMQRILIGNAPFSNTPLPSSFTPATDNRPLLYMTSNGIWCVFVCAMWWSQQKRVGGGGGVLSVKCKKDWWNARKLDQRTDYTLISPIFFTGLTYYCPRLTWRRTSKCQTGTDLKRSCGSFYTLWTQRRVSFEQCQLYDHTTSFWWRRLFADASVDWLACVDWS
jgi:hypothetical protein